MIKGFDQGAAHNELQYFGGNLDCQLPSKCLHGIFNNENLNNNTNKAG